MPTDDDSLVRAFVRDGARSGGQGSLRIETNCLILDRWWPVAFRVAPDTFGLRADDPPSAEARVEEVATELRALGLSPVATNPPLLHVITLTEIAFGLVSWELWAPDAASGEAALVVRAGTDTTPGPLPREPPF